MFKILVVLFIKNSNVITLITIIIMLLYRRASSRGIQGVRTPALFRYSPNCALKFLNQFRKNPLKNQFIKRKNPLKQCTNSILLKFFNATLTIARQKNAQLIFEKLHIIRKLKFHIFNSMAVIFHLSFHRLSYFRVIHNL